MRRPLYIKELAALPFPLGLIGHLLAPYERCLRAICFADNESGDRTGAPAMYQRRVVEPANVVLARNGKPLRLVSMCVAPSRHHTVQVLFKVKNKEVWADDNVYLSLFLASKKAMAMERKANEAGEEYTVVAPRRGDKPAKKVTNRKRKRQKGRAAVA